MRRGLGDDPGITRSVEEAVEWIGRAQDRSRSTDGGVSRHWSFIDEWAPSYPETTGYIVPTLLDWARRSGDMDARDRARRMLEWLCAIQLPEGGFQGGVVGAAPRVPVTFNTGQIVLGLAAGVQHLGDEFRRPLRRAADWLVATQDADGCWRRHVSPFAAPGEKVYDTHVAWSLFEAERVEPGRGYADAAMANVRWALTHQLDNGWFDRCCLTATPDAPFTHTIGYVLRGITEAFLFSGDPQLLRAARRTVEPIVSLIEADGFLAGRLDEHWQPRVPWSCLTGSVQIAHCLLLLHSQDSGNRWRAAAESAIRYVRRTQKVEGLEGVRGGIKGSFPVNGAYCAYELPNWASKFLIDANLLASELPIPEVARDRASFVES